MSSVPMNNKELKLSLRKALRLAKQSKRVGRGKRKGKTGPHRPRLDRQESDAIVRGISEAAYNVTRGNVPMTSKRRSQLKPLEKYIKQLSRPSVSLKKKKRILNQRGGALLPLLIPPVLSLLSKFAADAILSSRKR